MLTSFLLILLATALYGALHSILAANTVKVFFARRLGQHAYRRGYRFFFSVMGGLTLLPVLALVALLPDRPIYTIPAPWRYLTLAVQLLSLLGLLWTVMQTGAMRFVGLQQLLEPTSQSDPIPEKLVVNGMYRWVRHPLYTFSFLLLWLTPVMTWNILALNLGFSAYLVIGSMFEENKLIEQFGQPYLTYRQTTPRLIPFLNRLKPPS